MISMSGNLGRLTICCPGYQTFSLYCAWKASGTHGTSLFVLHIFTPIVITQVLPWLHYCIMSINQPKTQHNTILLGNKMKQKFTLYSVARNSYIYFESWQHWTCNHVTDYLFILFSLSNADFLEAIRSLSVRSPDRGGCSWYPRHHQTTRRVWHIAWGGSRRAKWSWAKPYPKPCYWGFSSGGCTGTGCFDLYVNYYTDQSRLHFVKFMPKIFWRGSQNRLVYHGLWHKVP